MKFPSVLLSNNSYNILFTTININTLIKKAASNKTGYKKMITNAT